MEAFSMVCGAPVILAICAGWCLVVDPLLERARRFDAGFAVLGIVALLPGGIALANMPQGSTGTAAATIANVLLVPAALVASPALASLALVVGRRAGLTKGHRIAIAAILATLAGGILLFANIVADESVRGIDGGIDTSMP